MPFPLPFMIKAILFQLLRVSAVSLKNLQFHIQGEHFSFYLLDFGVGYAGSSTGLARGRESETQAALTPFLLPPTLSFGAGEHRISGMYLSFGHS